MAARQIAHRTRGHNQGPITRLMSPADLGEVLKPFVFLDFVDHDVREPFKGSLHPHSGIATLTYLIEGSGTYVDPDNVTGVMTAGGVEWMQAGLGMWHGGGGPAKSERILGFQLWIALPPDLELGRTVSLYQSAEDIPADGPARVLLGSYGSASSAINAPSPTNYLAVRLTAGERWKYEPPAGHTVLWTAVASGAVLAPDELTKGDLVSFAPGSQEVEFEAVSDTEFVLGSAAPHKHDLVLGPYSVHTSPDALRAGEAHILELRKRLVEEGRL